MDKIIWIKNPTFDSLTTLKPNRKTRDEFETSLNEHFHTTIINHSSYCCFKYQDLMIKIKYGNQNIFVSFLKDGVPTRSSKFDILEGEIYLLWGLSAQDIESKNSINFVKYILALFRLNNEE